MKTYPLKGNSMLIDVANGIALVTLNRPEQHNALNRELRTNIAIALESLQIDDEVQVIIFTGAGEKSFSVGMDLREFQESPMTAEEVGIGSRVLDAFSAMTKPMIAAINGYAVTGGLELACNCDILVSSSNAEFADTHVRVGVRPGWGISQNLRQKIGPVRTNYIAYTGNYIDAKTAKEWGLVLDVVEYDQLLPYCQKLAKDIIDVDQPTLRDYRSFINQGMLSTTLSGYELESKVSKDTLEKFDPTDFSKIRDKVMNRGKKSKN